MRTSVYIFVAVVFVALALSSAAAWGQGKYTAGELDEMLGPIALYPDPLLAQIFPASTFLDQLVTAAQFSGPSSAIDNQPWDVSVKAIAHYPEVLDMMVKNPDWTTAIGQAFVDQPVDVMASVQRLRAKAEAIGNLNSNAQQQVSTSNGVIAVVPAQPQYIFVPQYNPQTVFVQPASPYNPWVTFGAGLLIGAWLNNSINWHNHYVYFHGWHGGGWIGRSRPWVNWRNPRYNNPNWRNRRAPIDRGVTRRNIDPYRRDIRRNVGGFTPPVRPENRPGMRPGVPTVPERRPGTPGWPSTRPSVPGGPGVGPTRPTRPGGPSVRPGVPSTRPAAPGVRPGHPTTRPTTPGVRPTHRNTRPSGMHRPAGAGGGHRGSVHHGGGHRGGHHGGGAAHRGGGGRRGR